MFILATFLLLSLIGFVIFLLTSMFLKGHRFRNFTIGLTGSLVSFCAAIVVITSIPETILDQKPDTDIAKISQIIDKVKYSWRKSTIKIVPNIGITTKEFDANYGNHKLQINFLPAMSAHMEEYQPSTGSDLLEFTSFQLGVDPNYYGKLIIQRQKYSNKITAITGAFLAYDDEQGATPNLQSVIESLLLSINKNTSQTFMNKLMDGNANKLKTLANHGLVYEVLLTIDDGTYIFNLAIRPAEEG